ncbi:hypothetical protein M440DRAFT_1390158 [Trichoderma longibrachiatum ATCC 18648]|uniref:MFS general substrate transporter n=1 Tax=Trichoderma longibrachiatum ATCC 18648 TaxID=983965 RepID=A0A2T4CAA1_TRILO|nr:hypothetical protein M440DRAFT_1390158 [Trichoderma longibrachiatum ATCC 18648]
MCAFFLVGGGYGAMLTSTLLACIAAVDHSQQAVITSATYLARSLGGTIGVTVSSAVYQNVLKDRLWKRFGDEPHAAEIIQKIRDDLNFLKHLPPGWHDGVLDSFMEAFRGVWFTMLALAIGALICNPRCRLEELTWAPELTFTTRYSIRDALAPTDGLRHYVWNRVRDAIDSSGPPQRTATALLALLGPPLQVEKDCWDTLDRGERELSYKDLKDTIDSNTPPEGGQAYPFQIDRSLPKKNEERRTHFFVVDVGYTQS